MIDWTLEQDARLAYSYERFSQSKVFVFGKWCEQANERGIARPDDLSGACKYGSLFVAQVFGGCIRGHYQHQYNHIGGRIVDLSHDALDVGKMDNPYLHEPDYFAIPEKRAALNRCLPRVEAWVSEFIEGLESV
ncbi:hypothetical protein JCM14076_23140 [Methylosoma difficile]